MGIKHQRSEKYCPWQNGKIERLFGTLKNRLQHYTLPSVNLTKELNTFNLWYNACRPHQALKGKTPLEQFTGKQANQSGKAIYQQFWDGALTGFYLPPD